MKRKMFIFFLLFIAFFIHGFSQNLIPNYSFEDTIKCPNGYFYFKGYVSNWSGVEPGYFTPYCNDGGLGGMPENAFGYQYPHSGHAYTGIITFANAGKDTSVPSYKQYHNSRDYIQDSLISPLQAGKRYYVTFYVSLGDSEQYACNNIGAYFSDSSLVFSREVLSYHSPQVENDTSYHLTDKVNWTKITGSFIASGGEQYIIIGNFTPDNKVDTIFVNSSASHVTYNYWAYAYYYIDDVIVTTDSNYADSLETALQNISSPKEEVYVFPNPSSGKFALEIKNHEVGIKSVCEVYNMLGEKVFNCEINSELTEIDLSGQSQGLYLYRVIDVNDKLISQGKLIIQH